MHLVHHKATFRERKKRKNLPRSRSLKLFLRVELQISIFFSTVLITIDPILSMLLCIIKCLHKFLTGTFLNLDHQNPSLSQGSKIRKIPVGLCLKKREGKKLTFQFYPHYALFGCKRITRPTLSHLQSLEIRRSLRCSNTSIGGLWGSQNVKRLVAEVRWKIYNEGLFIFIVELTYILLYGFNTSISRPTLSQFWSLEIRPTTLMYYISSMSWLRVLKLWKVRSGFLG